MYRLSVLLARGVSGNSTKPFIFQEFHMSEYMAVGQIACRSVLLQVSEG